MRLIASLPMLLAWGCSSPDTSATGDAGAERGQLGCLQCLDAPIDVPPAVRIGALLAVCAGDDCHNTGKANLVIAGANDFSGLINVRSLEVPSLYRVSPGDPAHSYAYMKLACEGGTLGSCMPPGAPLDPVIIQTFQDWIEGGAPTH